MKQLRIGIIGVGNMGSHHLATLGRIEDAEVTAVCDRDPARLEPLRERYRTFERSQDLLESGLVDAVVVATPHYDHPRIAAAAFACGLHVLSEKPVAVDIASARETAELHRTRHPHLKYAAMFQVRTSPVFRKIHDLIAAGELGEITRLTWIVTDWFRTWTYYASGGWRATWKGEGGGVLLNQCPHNLDLIQWMLGGMMPSRVTAVAAIGKTHPIEVEDEISAILEYPNGAIGHFIATTGEAPGTNRLEIAGDRGLLVCEGGNVLFRRTRQSVRDVRERSPNSFPVVEAWNFELPIKRVEEGSKVILRNFIEAIRDDVPLIAPAVEGLRSLEMGNAMLLAGITRRPVDLPLDGEAYRAFLAEMAERHAGRKTLDRRADAAVDMAASFTK